MAFQIRLENTVRREQGISLSEKSIYEPQIPQCFPAVSGAKASVHYALPCSCFLLSMPVPPPWLSRMVHLKQHLWDAFLVQEQDGAAPAAFLQVVPHHRAQTEAALLIN